ncbi:hypothetical protein F511_24336 [Dorcoceras hygrometricum]|uniref:Uncharacterized protein n=1 Tax=Dorcoceras hygrometricum TaxID=472368 RepID=A0A2Z7D560_9LAMI|nr:hypothetical protein F511_24336 [Dorcoceras hygrometricum]
MNVAEPLAFDNTHTPQLDQLPPPAFPISDSPSPRKLVSLGAQQAKLRITRAQYAGRHNTCQRRQHYTQGRSDVNTTGLLNSDVNTKHSAVVMSAVVARSVVVSVQSGDSVLSVAGAFTSSFGLVGTTVFWTSKEESALLFTEPYVLRLPMVDSSDESKSGSVGLLLLRHFIWIFLSDVLEAGEGSAGGVCNSQLLFSVLRPFSSSLCCLSRWWIYVARTLFVVIVAQGIEVSQVSLLVVALTQLEVPQEVDRVSQLAYRIYMPPRRRDRDSRQIPEESEGQTEGDQRSFPRRGRGRHAEDEIGNRRSEKQLAGRRLARRRPPCRAHGTIARWPRDGRSHVARWPCDTNDGGWAIAPRPAERRALVARWSGQVARRCAPLLASGCATRTCGDAPCAKLADHCRCCCTTTPHAGRCWPERCRALMRRWGALLRAMVRALPPRFFRGGGAAVAGRRSGDVVTADPNSFRV